MSVLAWCFFCFFKNEEVIFYLSKKTADSFYEIDGFTNRLTSLMIDFYFSIIRSFAVEVLQIFNLT